MSDVAPTNLAEALAKIFAMQNVTLADRLGAYAQAMRELKSPFADEYDRLIARLAAGQVGEGAPNVGELMPGFLLPDADGRLVGLDELLADGPLVISFNRGHWCPFCKIELTALAEADRDFVSFAARVVSIMPERQAYTQTLQAQFGNRLLFLTDMDNSYALSMGLVMWVGETIGAMMQARGWRLDEFQGNGAWFLPLPATFVVGCDGRVKARYIDPDFRRRMSIDDILSALQSEVAGAPSQS